MYPNAYIIFREKRLKLQKTIPLIEDLNNDYYNHIFKRIEILRIDDFKPGEVVDIDIKTGITIATKDHFLLLIEAQLEGKQSKTGSELIQQLRLKPGINLTLNESVQI